MLTILNDIKAGTLKNIYLLYGEEPYLIHQYRDNLLHAMVEEGDTMNFERFEGKNIDVDAFIDLAETMPFFADYRTILVTDSKWFKNANERIGNYLKTAPETTRFIFVETEVDKRNKAYKVATERGRAVEFPKQNEAMLRNWILARMKKENKRIKTDALDLFLTKTGVDMNNIALELEKLFCYTMNKTDILPEDVEEIVTTSISSHIFDMITAIGTQQQSKALHLYYELLALKEPVPRIMSLIIRQFNFLLQVKELRTKGYDKQGMARKLDLKDFIVDKYTRQAKLFSAKTLRNAIDDIAAVTENARKGMISEQMALEVIIVKYSAVQEKQ